MTDWLERQLAGPHACADILERAPNLTQPEGYRVQRALVERRLAQGDRIGG